MTSSPTAPLVTDEMRSIVGSVVDRRVSFPVAASDIRRWVIAVHHPDPAPPELLAPGAPAPAEFNPFAWLVAERIEPLIPYGSRDADRYEKTAGVHGPGLAFQVAAGLDVEYGVPMVEGDVIVSVTTLEEYREKQGRVGPMLFTVLRDEWTNQDGERVKVIRETSIRYA
ncbi:FAS1-like dehydratase domain-containing protein [Nocardioides endophyticus]|uniref:FAS1-like dehydratase domain-containing protein n=1 Tax=Nocardioides endophyticus TaxID=1353775 RepID=UPI0031E6AFB8